MSSSSMTMRGGVVGGVEVRRQVQAVAYLDGRKQRQPRMAGDVAEHDAIAVARPQPDDGRRVEGRGPARGPGTA